MALQQIRVRKASVITLILVVLYRIVLDAVYYVYVSRFFQSYPLDFSLSRLAQSYVVSVLLALLLQHGYRRAIQPATIAIYMYSVFLVFPILTMYAMADASLLYVTYVCISVSVLFLVYDVFPRLPPPRVGESFLLLALVIVCLCSLYVYGYLVGTGGLGRLSFNITGSELYSARAEYVARRGFPLGYLVPWQANVFNMALLVYALYRRSILWIGVSLTIQLMLFGMTGFKSFLFAPALVLAVFVSFSRFRVLNLMLFGALMLCILSYTSFLLTGDQYIPSIFVRRLLFAPSSVQLVYYEFFSEVSHPLVRLSNSILAPFFEYPYAARVTHVVSQAHFGREFGLNVGYLGDAYAHFGFPGMIAFSALLGLILRVIDSAARWLLPNLAGALIAVPAFALVNSGLFTTMLTHGLLVATILSWALGSRAAGLSRQPIGDTRCEPGMTGTEPRESSL